MGSPAYLLTKSARGNLCRRCGDPARDDRTTCDECGAWEAARAQRNKERKQGRERFKTMRPPTYCAKPFPVSGNLAMELARVPLKRDNHP
jgi:predicted amidophosphoribosyltransferase